jgi:hypothetical protein
VSIDGTLIWMCEVQSKGDVLRLTIYFSYSREVALSQPITCGLGKNTQESCESNITKAYVRNNETSN